MSDRRPVAILGSGGHAKVVLDACLNAGLEVSGLLDPQLRRGEVVAGRPVLGSDDLIADPAFSNEHAFLIGIGDQRERERLADLVRAHGGSLATVVHPRATVAPGTRIGPGTVVLAGAVVNPGAELGECVIVHSNAVVDHDDRLEHGVQVCPGAALAGGVRCGSWAFIGTGASVAPGCTIGARAIVGAGAVVIGDVASGVTVVGNPARVVERAAT